MNKAQKLEKKRIQEYYECQRQEEIRKEENLNMHLKKLDRVFKFLDLTDECILEAISKKIDSEVLLKIVKIWSEGNLKEEKKAQEFKTDLAQEFSSDEFFTLYENLKPSDKEDFQESFVCECEYNGLLTFNADTLEKQLHLKTLKKNGKTSEKDFGC